MTNIRLQSLCNKLGSSLSWSNDSWINNYLCNQCIWPLTLRVRTSLDITLCDKVCQWLAAGWWFPLGTSVSCTNKTDRHDITIFASQRLRSALLIFTLGIASRIFVIPAHCHLLDFNSYAPFNDVIFNQSTRGFHFLSFECPENWLEIIIWLIFKRRFDEAHTVIQW